MKKITFIFPFLIFGMFYLFGCFSEASFNIKYWNVSTRDMISMFGGMITLMAFVGAIMYNFNDNRNDM